mmetsp:Transcript_7889/g.25854  ORF Transcript_7889/g.25854 Transcript_7889/m.25854 type:complete len:223 (+) Transcript_7889:406-1074(+)
MRSRAERARAPMLPRNGDVAPRALRPPPLRRAFEPALHALGPLPCAAVLPLSGPMPPPRSLLPPVQAPAPPPPQSKGTSPLRALVTPAPLPPAARVSAAPPTAAPAGSLGAHRCPGADGVIQILATPSPSSRSPAPSRSTPPPAPSRLELRFGQPLPSPAAPSPPSASGTPPPSFARVQPLSASAKCSPSEASESSATPSARGTRCAECTAAAVRRRLAVCG